MAFVARAVIRADRQQAGVFALRTGVGLQAHRVVARAFDQHRLERIDQLGIALRLRRWRQRMDIAELRPGHRDHLGGGVELHGAAAQRDHCAIHRQILVGQRAHVAQQFVLAVMRVEHRMREEGAAAAQAGGQGVVGAGIQRVDVVDGHTGAEQLGQCDYVLARGGFIQADAEAPAVDATKVEPRRFGLGVDGLGVDVDHVQCVEEIRPDGDAGLAQRIGQDRAEAVHATGDAGQAFGTVIHRVHAGHDGEQHLRGADIRRGLLAADVLLARLQGEPIRRLAFRIDGYADQAAWHRALVRIAAGHEGRMRAAVAERHAEALRVADDDVGAPFARRRDQGQRQQVGRHRDERAARVGGIGQRLVIVDLAEGIGILQQHAEAVDAGGFGVIADMQLEAHRLGAGVQHFQRLRMHAARHEEDIGLGLARALGQRHRLGGGGGFVQQGRVGDLHAGEVGAQRLEVDQRFHAALRNFRLIRRVGRVPGRILEDIAQDHVRRVRTVVALADKAAEHLVLVGDGADLGQRFDLGDRLRQRQRRRRFDRGRHDRVGHRFQRIMADDVQHLRDLGIVRADMALDEGVVMLEFAQRRGMFVAHDWRHPKATCRAARRAPLCPFA